MAAFEERDRHVNQRLSADPAVDGPADPADPSASAADPCDDLDALQQIARGVLQRFDWFVDRYKAPLLNYICSRTRNYHTAEDLAQETFLRVFAAGTGGKFHGRTRCLAGWIFTIAGNCVADHFRTRARRPVTVSIGDDQVPDDHRPGPAEAMSRSEQCQAVYEWLDRLPEAQAEVVRLRALAGLSFPEIAKALDAPLAAVKSRMCYGLTKMHKMEEESGDLTP